MKSYKIVRFDPRGGQRTIRTGLTLEEAGRALTEAASGTQRTGAARAEAAPLRLLPGRDVLAEVEQKRQETRTVARDAAVLCTLAMAALALVLLIFERAYA